MLHRTPKSRHGSSSGSSLDPIAISDDEEEFVISQLIPSSPESPPEHASFKPEARTSTLENVSANGAENRKPNPSSSAGVPSPPERSTRILSRSRDLDSTKVSSPKCFENLEDIDIMYGEISEPLAIHITNVVFPRPTRPTETTPDSTPDGSHCDEDLTAQDIDRLLGAVRVPFDFSLSRHHLASSENDGQSEGNSLWWYHPIFEARAKADIRRTLSALLPSDPAQDPPFPGAGEVLPRRSAARIWAERLKDASGPRPLDSRSGKPRRVARPAGVANREAADGLHFQNGAGANAAADRAFRRLEADGVALVDAVNEDTSESEATALTAALTPLVKGRTMLDKAKMVRFIDAPGEVDRTNERRNTSASTYRVTKKRFRPDDAELMSRKELPNWKRCTWCVRRKVKCIPRVGSQPPYQCFHCEDNGRKCIPYKKEPRRPGEYQLHPRLKLANNATGASLRRHPRLAGPSHLKDKAYPIPAPPPSGPVRRAVMRRNKLRLAGHQVRYAELEAYRAEHAHNLKVALERKRLADEQLDAALDMLDEVLDPPR